MVVYNRAQAQKQLKANLASRGYHAEMLKEQPGYYIPMYWHRDRYGVDGSLAYKAGEISPRQSTLKDNQDRMNVRGLTDAQVAEGYLSMLPWPPGENCTCKTCQETYRDTEKPIEATVVPDAATAVAEPADASLHVKQDDLSCSCGWASKAPKKSSRRTALYNHSKVAVTMAEAT